MSSYATLGPGIDGYAVARQLRADKRLSATLLVALTGYAQSDDKERGEQAGFDAHLTKPATFDELNRILTRAA